jgi:hypothetical protein
LVPLLLHARFQLLINLNEKKRVYSKNSQNFPIFYSFLAKSKDYVNSIVVVFYCISSSILNIIWAIYGFKCNQPLIDILVYLHFGVLFVEFMFLMLVVLYDLIKNWRLLLKCQWRTYFILNDPFYWRIEMALASFFVISLIPWLLPFSKLIRGIITDICLVTYICVFVMFPLTITIFRKINRCFIKSRKYYSNNQEINLIFKHDVLIKLLMEYAENEFSSENVKFKIDHLNYLNQNSKNKRGPLVNAMVANYLSGKSSPFELNVDNSNKSKFQKKLLVYQKTENYEDDLFDSIMTAVNLNISDTVSRFQFTYKYIMKVNQLELVMGESFRKASLF